MRSCYEAAAVFELPKVPLTLATKNVAKVHPTNEDLFVGARTVGHPLFWRIHCASTTQRKPTPPERS